MKTLETLGIDDSKLSIDVHLHVDKGQKRFVNSHKGFQSLLAWLARQTGLDIAKLLICFEHTGLYSLRLAVYLDEKQITFSMVSGLEVKKSMGIRRGKNDKVDTARIAEYAHLRASTLEPYQLPSKAIVELQQLLQLRARMVQQRAGYKTSYSEYKAMLTRKDNPSLFTCQEAMMRQLDKQILKVETQIRSIINEHEQINQLYQLVTSVKGGGFVLGCHFIVITRCFSGFDNSRQFACYSGIAPFKQQSGSSLNSKSKVSHYANKKIKALLDRAAMSAIQHDPEIKAYYAQRLDSGKSKRSTINIVRNKIVSRVFAVVRRGTPFVPIYRHAV